MACKLTKVAPRTFNGKTGDTVQITVDSDSGAAFIVSAIYDGNSLSSPWTFQIGAGPKQLAVVVEDPNVGDPIRIQEVCGGSNQTLVASNFDPQGPTQALVIIGV